MSDDKLRAAAERGRQFAAWCNGADGLFAVFQAVERDYLETLMGSDIADHPLREKAYHRIAALRDLRRVMDVAIAEGKGAQAMIEQMNKAIEKRKKVRA